MRLELSWFMIPVAAVPIALCLVLLGVCRRKEGGRGSRFVAAAAALDVPLDRFGGGFYSKLVLVSALGLFFEMLLIRWLSSELSLLGYYKNTVLVACYLGFGVGCYLSERRVHLSCLFFPLMVIVPAVCLPWESIRSLRDLIIVLIGSASTVPVWSAQPFGAAVACCGTLLAAAVFFVIPMFALVVFTFVPLGQMTGALLERAKNGITAYSVNVAAALAGILLFALLGFLHQPPTVWYGVAAVLVVWLVWRIPLWRWTGIAVFGVILAAVSYAPPSPARTFWSPYQKLRVTPHCSCGELVSYSLTTNNSWNQQIIDLSDPFVKKHPALFDKEDARLNLYDIPYRFYPDPPSVLILGSGMGNDAAAALRHGAGKVTAVEIDPLIVKLGKRLHFERPYCDPRVTVVTDDARNFIQNARERFSLIIFALLDAQTTCSNFSNVRIDNYAYTVEALRTARRLLARDGVFIIKFQIDNTHWIAGRLRSLMEEVFGQAPLEVQSPAGGYVTRGRFFVAAPGHRIAGALEDDSFLRFALRNPGRAPAEAAPTTDDWPFFYQHKPGIPAGVTVFSLVMAACALLFSHRAGVRAGKRHLHFFFLGAGFMLLEVRSVSAMALLFGTTWMVNAIVVGGILVLIVCANMLVGKVRAFPYTWAYAGIGAAIVLSYLLPLRLFFMEPAWLKAVSAAALLLSPVFFAGIVFIRSYASAGFKGEALGANLLGALAGGLLESLSLWTGLRSLLIVALVMYLLSYFFLRNRTGVLPGC